MGDPVPPSHSWGLKGTRGAKPLDGDEPPFTRQTYKFVYQTYQMLFVRADLMLRENGLPQAVTTAPSALPYVVLHPPQLRCDFALTQTLLQQTELARRAPGQGHGTTRGIHEMQMAQQGNAKQGLPVEAS